MAIDFTLSPELEDIRLRVRIVRRGGRQARRGQDLGVTDGRRRADRIARSTSRCCSACARPPRMRGCGCHTCREEWGGMGLGHVELAMVQAEAAKASYGPVRAQLPGSRRRQHAHAVALGDTGAEGEVPAPVVRRNQDELLRDDRARGGRQRPDADPDDGRAGRRRVGHQRSQVVHLQRSARRIRDPAGAHRGQPGSAAGGQHRVHRRHSVGRVEPGARSRDDARRQRSQRDRHRGPASTEREHARWTRPGSPTGSVSPRAGAGSRTACDGSPRPRQRST